MAEAERAISWMHEDAVLFRQAVSFTAAETGFAAELVEKDYFCTLLLSHLAAVAGPHVFKGGTCLAKVHAGFYRLSEDLDFMISLPLDAARSQRSKMATGLRSTLAELPAKCGCFSVASPWAGANNSTQYASILGYESLLSEQRETIKVELSLREPLIQPPLLGLAKTLLLHPASGRPAVQPLPVLCINRLEAFAEKFRAALTRREAAIRDFFDIDYAVRRLGLVPMELVSLIRRKLAVPGNAPVDVGREKRSALSEQLRPILRPVLREQEFGAFDLDRAFTLVSDLAEAVS